jgi:hypothetical protein
MDGAGKEFVFLNFLILVPTDIFREVCFGDERFVFFVEEEERADGPGVGWSEFQVARL